MQASGPAPSAMHVAQGLRTVCSLIDALRPLSCLHVRHPAQGIKRVCQGQAVQCRAQEAPSLE